MSTPKERLKKLSEDQRNALLDPAETEFITHGYEAASLNRILVTAGMSKGQAYYYITGKSDLYLAVCVRRFEPLLDIAENSMTSLTATDDFWQIISKLCGELVEKLEKNANLAELARGIYDSSSAAASLAPLSYRLNHIMNQMITIGQNNGVIRSDLPDELIRNALKSAAYAIDRWFAGAKLSPSEQCLSNSPQTYG